MKVNEQEKQTLSDAIDKLNEGLDVFIQLYNDADKDLPLIVFEEDTIQIIEKAKKVYGASEINDRINKILKEILTLLPIKEGSSKKDDSK
ncbi:atypical membrane-integrating protein (Mistic protein) [Bacillus sp. DJP31]|uniref:atypical membrane-integrating protein (Mistic protein) n=1 Tax=Bacillus sp. DJP31 TaxID=3409789 RepID=UPI003BB716F7